MKEKEPLLEVRHLKKYFPAAGGATVKAVDDVSFTIYKGETLGMVGESGLRQDHLRAHRHGGVSQKRRRGPL